MPLRPGDDELPGYVGSKEVDDLLCIMDRFRHLAASVAADLRQRVINEEPLTTEEAQELRSMLKALRKLQTAMKRAVPSVDCGETPVSGANGR